MSRSFARELPTVDIEGTEFYIDLRIEQFREKANFANQIPFDAFTETGFKNPNRQYMVLYDRDKKNVSTEKRTGKTLPPHIVKIIMPEWWRLDPVGHARKKQVPDDYYVQQIIREDKELAAKRLGKMYDPSKHEIEIAGTVFLFDIVDGCLFEKNDVLNVLPYDDMGVDFDKNKYLLNYDVRTKNTFYAKYPGDTKKNKQFIVKVTIPTIIDIDKEAAGIACGLGKDAFLKSILPVPKARKAPRVVGKKGRGFKL